MSTQQAIFSSLLPGVLALLAGSLAADPIRSQLIGFASYSPGLSDLISRLAQSPVSTRRILILLLTLEFIRRLNHALNILAANSWRLTTRTGWNWSNEIAVVTGGSSGIGKEVVKNLAGKGLRVAVLDIQVLPQSLQANTLVSFYKCDVTNSSSVATAANAIHQELGHPSILINNAGIASFNTILDVTEAKLHQIIGINTVAHWLTTKQFLPHMVKSDKGHIVTVASKASFISLAKAADYSASKAGALAFHEALRSELRHCYKATNVLTTIVHTNWVRTPLLKKFESHLESQGAHFLTSEYVADRIVTQLLSRTSGQLYIPWNEAITAGIRAWPTWAQELVADIYGRMSASA